MKVFIVVGFLILPKKIFFFFLERIIEVFLFCFVLTPFGWGVKRKYFNILTLSWNCNYPKKWKVWHFFGRKAVCLWGSANMKILRYSLFLLPKAIINYKWFGEDNWITNFSSSMLYVCLERKVHETCIFKTYHCLLQLYLSFPPVS